MNLLLPLIILIILAVLYAGSVSNPRIRLYIVIAVLVGVIFLCWLELKSSLFDSMGLRNEGFTSSSLSGYSPLNYVMRIENTKSSSGKNSTTGCDGYNYMDVNSQISPMGTYDGIRLPSKFNTAPLMKDVFITSPVGDDIKLTVDPASKFFPSVDGTPNGEKHLFVFAKNNYGGDCHSQYSTSTGQLCMSPEQINMFMGRGKNLTAPQEYPMV
jgi:hypothetical protein